MNSKSSNRRGDESPAFDGSNTMRELRGKMERALSICTTNTNNNNNAYISPTKLSSIGQQDGGGGGPRTGTATGTSRNIYTSTPTYKQHDTNNYNNNNNNNNSYILPNKIPISPVAMAATPTNRTGGGGGGGGGAGGPGSGFMSPTFSKENPYGRSKNSPFLKPPHSPSPNKSTTHTSLSPTSSPQVLLDLAVASNLMPSPIPPHTDYTEPVSRAPSSSLSSSIHAVAEAKHTPSALPTTTTTSSSTTATSPRTRGPDSKLTSNDQADAKYSSSTRYESKATHHSEPSYTLPYSDSKQSLNTREYNNNDNNNDNTLDTLKRKSQRMKVGIDQEYEREQQQSYMREQEYKHTQQHTTQHATQQSQQGQGQAYHYISESHSSGSIAMHISSAGQAGHIGHSSSSNSIPSTAAEDKATYSYSSSFSTSPQVRNYLHKSTL